MHVVYLVNVYKLKNIYSFSLITALSDRQPLQWLSYSRTDGTEVPKLIHMVGKQHSPRTTLSTL